MNFPDPKSLVQKYRQSRAFNQMGLGQILEAIQTLEQEIATLRAGLAHFESTEWKWLTENLLPREHQRIAMARSVISPEDSIKQAIAQGQINEIIHLQSILLDGKQRIETLQTQLESARETEAKLRKRSQNK